MTSQGSAHAHLRRALASGNVTIALAAAAELPRVPLDDALAILVLLRDDERRFDRAVNATNGELLDTGYPVWDTNNTGWAHANRAANEFCQPGTSSAAFSTATSSATSRA
jgi:hypothetical protein